VSHNRICPSCAAPHSNPDWMGCCGRSCREFQKRRERKPPERRALPSLVGVDYAQAYKPYWPSVTRQ
jgi:hypothetical protein